MVADAVKRFGLLQPGDRVLCALSGGADSVCLTHALAKLAGAGGFAVAAAHFSHGLRPESAAYERELCQRLCEGLSIPLFCGAGDTPAYAAEHGVGMEEAARTLRRAFLEETARSWQATAIATGHHLEDSAETLLLNLIRGSGTQGFQGIPPRNGRWIRPLILCSKEEILGYLEENRLKFAQDPTNFHGNNARARLRREVFPTLNGLNAAAARHLARAALESWQRDEAIRTEADELTSAVHVRGGEVSIPVSGLRKASREAAVRVLQTLQRQAGGSMLEQPHITALLALAAGDDPSAQAHLPGTRALRRYDALVFTRQKPLPPPEPVEVWPDRPVAFGPWEITLRTETGPGMAVPACELPLTVRSRQPGDTISMAYGKKSLKKLLIERKIPKDLRDTVPILCNNREILAVGDLCTAHLPGEKNFFVICRRKEI